MLKEEVFGKRGSTLAHRRQRLVTSFVIQHSLFDIRYSFLHLHPFATRFLSRSPGAYNQTIAADGRLAACTATLTQ